MPQILEIIKTLYDNHGDEVEKWMAEQRFLAAPYFYTSVDLRHSALRLAPVDTNLYPAGFNNLSPAARGRASKIIADFFRENYPGAKRVIIIPENHTRNLAYFDNLHILQSLLLNAGLEAKIGSLAAPPGEKLEFTSALGAKIEQYPLAKNNNTLSLENGFTPDLIIMNNDMTSGVPELLQDVKQPVIPPTGMGWFQRRKSTHFAEYKKLIEDFGSKFGIDPWRLSAQFHHCGMVDFKDKNSLECLAQSIGQVLDTARAKHKEYGISEEPYVYIKADSGTYGMGIMTVNSADEVLELNKKERNKMQVIKEGARVSEVIIQEGIATIDMVDNAPAEPMVYMIDGIPVGGMYRINDHRDAFGNLNAAGMRFVGMCDESENDSGKWKKMQNCNFHSHGIIAAIAALAAAREQYPAHKREVAA